MSGASVTLPRLLRRGETAHRRRDARPVRLRMSPQSCPEYAGLESLAALEIFHAEIALAERDGAITVERDLLRGDGSRLVALTLRNAGGLARHLGVPLLNDQTDTAARLLQPWRESFPVIDDVVAAWREGRKVRGASADGAVDLADASRAAVAADPEEERILRRESIRLFGDSKRLESLWSWLDLLRSGELKPSGLARDEVLAAWGFRREPQPFLLAGVGRVHVDGQWLPLVRPWLGLPMHAFGAIRSEARWVLSIENLSTFHEAARALGPREGILIYTGGMPSPAWRAAYRRLLAGVPADSAVYHWGDIDEGGFRIAAALATEAAAEGRALKPWCMSAETLPEDVRAQSLPADSTTLGRMRNWAERAGWSDLAIVLDRTPLKLEQEAIAAVFPD